MVRYYRIITIVLALLILAGFIGAAVKFSYMESRTDFFSRAGGIQHRLETTILALADPAEQCSAFYQANSWINADDFRLFSEWIMNRFPFVSGMIFAPLIPAAERSRFEEAMREEGLVTFSIHAPEGESTPHNEGNSLPVLHLEPLRPESAFLLGLNLESRREFFGILSRVVSVDETLLVESPGLLGQTREFWFVRAVFRGRNGPITLDNAAGLILLRINLTTAVDSLLKQEEHVGLTLFMTGDSQSDTQLIHASHGAVPTGGFLHYSYKSNFSTLGCKFLTSYREEIPFTGILFNRMVAMASVAGVLIFMALMSLSREYRRRLQANEELSRLNIELERRVQERTAELATKNEALQRSGDMFQAVVEAAPTAIIGFDLEGQVHGVWNRAAEKMLGWSASEVMGRPFPTMSQKHQEEFEGFGKQIKSGSTLDGIEVHRQKRDGSPIDYSVYASPLYDPEGNITGNIAVLVDITTRKQAEEALRNSEKRLQDIIDCTSDWIWETNSRGIITFCGGQSYNLLGYEPEEILGHTPFDLMAPESRKTFNRRTAKIRTQKAPIVNLEDWHLTKNGRRVCLSTNGVPIIDPEGKVLGYRGAVQDITERKLLDDQLRRKNEDLERSNTELDEFAYIVSHDLKEPLRSIRSFSSFIMEDCQERLNTEGRSHLEIVIKSATRMEALLDDLLLYSRVGRAGLAMKPTDLGRVVTEVLEDMQTLLGEQNAYVTVAGDLPTVTCDHVRISEIFRNLIQNAVKYNDTEEKRIEVDWLQGETSGQNTPVFFVRDNGIGIREKHLDTVFRIFKRLHGRDQYGGGTGSGLTIVRKIIERHDGRVWVESEFGKGSTFYFTLGSGS